MNFQNQTRGRLRKKAEGGLSSALLLFLAFGLALGLGAAGCAGQPQINLNTGGTLGAQQLAQQESAAQAAYGVHVTFQFSDYYSLSSPNAENCAGDVRNYFDPIALAIPGVTTAALGYSNVAGGTALYSAIGVTGTTGPMPLPVDTSATTTQTIRPSFIKNISVDMTDANAAISGNLASSCSLGNSSQVPATSNCATFDYGSVGGIPSTLGGTMLVIGGVQNENYSGFLPAASQTTFPFQGLSLGCGSVVNQNSFAAVGASAAVGYTSCSSGMYALGVDILPASVFNSNPNLVPSYLGTTGPTGTVSMWANISGTQGFTGPAGSAGASASYDPGLQQVLLFGGSAPLAGFGTDAPGVTTYDTWLFDIKSQHWSYLSANIYLTNVMTTLYDQFFDIETMQGSLGTHFSVTAESIPKISGARSIMGYVAVPGTAMRVDAPEVDSASYAAGTMTGPMIDKTDRLLIVGGYAGGPALTGTHRFNPTYGPDLENVIGNVLAGAPDTILTLNNGGAGITQISTESPSLVPVQWVDSYETQLMSNYYGAGFLPTAPATPVMPFTDLSSRFTPDLAPLGTSGGVVPPTGGQPVVNSAFVQLVNNAGAGLTGTGYVLGTGGFDLTTQNNTPDLVTPDTAAMAVCTSNGAANVETPTTTPLFTTPSLWGTNTDLRCGGGLSLQTRFYNNGSTATEYETKTSHFGAVPNFVDPLNLPNTPALWTQYRENPDGTPAGHTQFVDFLGGQTMLPGFNLVQNDVLIFGGLDCRSYVQDPTSTCHISIVNQGLLNNSANPSPGRYYTFGTSPAQNLKPETTGTSNIPFNNATGNATWIQNGNPATSLMPFAAGMAAARGLDPAGNVIILAWGGAKAAGTVDGNGKIYYLNNLDLTATPPVFKPNAYKLNWGFASPLNQNVRGSPPAELINSQMVFSHVTKKFYLFGGFDPSNQITRGDTYELTLSSGNPASPSCVLGAPPGNPAPCIFTWRQLNQSTGVGLTCYPSTCPSPRRSHRMAEVNYFNRNPGGAVDFPGSTFDTTHVANYYQTGEQPCTPKAPCSYGIFMEGGSPDGLNYLSDRWMFDPTANGGNGSWQEMNEFPPRTLASMSSTDYTLPASGQNVHRAVLFGGETGLNNSEWAPTGYFVAPTLGDTWMFDYDGQTWDRVQLQGQGYSAGVVPTANLADASTEIAHRAAFNAAQPSLYPGGAACGTPGIPCTLGAMYAELSPPPLSGTVTVTRTLAPPPTGVSGPTSPLHSLPIPEVYVFGGRLKDGSFSPLDHVYKFCAGTTGEAFTYTPLGGFSANSIPNPIDYTCDAFDPINNPSSPNPTTAYTGRWLTKMPDGVTSTGATFAPASVGSYLGAGAYDLTRDRIVLFGGLTSLVALNPGTGSTAVTDTSDLIADANVYEYTPPQAQLGAIKSDGREGLWTFVPSCAGYPAPVGRYGHSMAYNSLGKNVVLMGGYSAGGIPLTTTIFDNSSGTNYTTPEVWSGTYCSDATCDSKLPVSPAVSLTNTPCYFWQPITVFGNSTAIQAQLPPETGLAHAATVFIPATGYNSGYYSMFDTSCPNEGPITSPDPSLNKLLAGGVYIDIDRTQLGPHENVLLNITYLPLGTNNSNPDASQVTSDESAVFRVHLIKTGQTQTQLESALQPRYMGYSNTQQYPQVVQSLSVLAPPSGQIAEEQVLIPLTTDPGIDRIRVERYSGSGILLDASVYRMGSK